MTDDCGQPEADTMTVASLGYRTDLMVRRLAGSLIINRGDHLAIRTPDNPGFYWGNFLLYPRAPEPGELAQWVEAFRAEFPTAGHVALGIDTTDGRLDVAAELPGLGLTPDISTVLTTAAMHEPPHVNRDASYRLLTSGDDWEQAVSLRSAVYDDAPTPEHVDFVQRQLAEARVIMATGQARYYGAFVADRLVAQLGVVSDGSGIARYQNVETAADHRGQGLAGSLVYEAGRAALERLDIRELVIVADPGESAIRLYQAVGFTAAEHQIQLQSSSSG
jgi:GNAT superfamily N-acetyltransferase